MKNRRSIFCALAVSVSMLSVAAQEFHPTSFSLHHVPACSGANTIHTSEISLSTDKACYAPGESVTFHSSGMPEGARVRYRHGLDVVDEQVCSGREWTWQPPSVDYLGYLADVYLPDGNGGERVLGTIAVDVSSDWTRFPRYGFIATFDATKSDDVVESDMAFLNRCHINGVQFQDWHNKHHWPLGGTRDNLLEVYKDIANRDIYTSVIKKYIEVQHRYGMKSIFYNLAFGALEDASSDGVGETWYLYRDSHKGERDKHDLPDDWKSDIYLVDPGNDSWLDYMVQRNDDVYCNLDFDGYQIDQLGYRGTLYNYYGGAVDLPAGYARFINRMKEAHPDKRLVMNGVSNYGADRILGTGKVDFAYTETWASESEFSNLLDIIRDNDYHSDGKVRTVFASYMNYEKPAGEMNIPGVLLTDAVMMALGGNHLELGDHMLSHEYFPMARLEMTEDLKTALIAYYDFSTAYQNLLRDTNSFYGFDGSVTLEGVQSNNWPPQTGKVTVYARRAGDTTDVYHLLNFVNAGDTSWRDLKGERPVPTRYGALPMHIDTDRDVRRVWMASPDALGGVPRLLDFKRSEGGVDVTVPSLHYWSMVVVEFNN